MMNPVFIILLFLAAFVLWICIAGLFNKIGMFLVSLFINTRDNMQKTKIEVTEEEKER